MANVLSQFTITDVAPGYWRVSFSNPQINLEDPDTILELQELVGRMETDPGLRVVVLESGDADFFIDHYDVSRAGETPVTPGPTGLPTWIDTATRLATTSVVTIAKIRGRNRGGGREISLACDLRFASREKAVFGQPEVGAGMFPGGGALERLPLLVGRARALEIILGSDDFELRQRPNTVGSIAPFPTTNWTASSLPSPVGSPRSTSRPSPRPSGS